MVIYQHSFKEQLDQIDCSYLIVTKALCNSEFCSVEFVFPELLGNR